MDIDYLLWLQSFRELTGGVLDNLMLFLTSLAESKISFLFLAFVYWCLDKKAGMFMGMNVALSCSFSQLFKIVCKIDRPWVRCEAVHPVEAAIPAATGYSFPSGHTIRAAATWGAFGFWRLRKGYLPKGSEAGAESSGRKGFGRFKFEYLFWVLILLVAFSRNYLGVHTPQDVGVGLAISAYIWLLSITIIDAADRGAGIFERNIDIICTLIFAAGIAVSFMFVGILSNTGAGLAFFISWMIDRRVLHYNPPANKKYSFAMFVVGDVFLVLILDKAWGLLHPVFGDVTSFAVSFITMFYIMVLFPLIMKKCE